MFERPLPGTLLKNRILGLPDTFLSGERQLKNEMGVKRKSDRLFFPFSQSSSVLVNGRGSGTWRGYLKEIEKAFSSFPSET